VLYVPGNHEGYGSHWEKIITKMKQVSKGTHVTILHRDQVIVNNMRFIGATGWSSFNAWPNRSEAMALAGMGRDPYDNGVKDYRFIRTGGYRRIRPSDTAVWNLRDIEFIENSLKIPFDGPTIVVTHHAPSVKSLKNGVTEPLDASDVNLWEHIIEKYDIRAWIHGHTHEPMNYWIGNTEIITNPGGYPGQNLSHRKDGIWSFSHSPNPILKNKL